MRKIIIFSYDGSKFFGLQRQKNLRSVQKEIEDALSKIYETNIQIKASGRTDAGVHALNQVAHFDCNIEIKDLKKKLNEILLPDIVIKKVKNVSNDFHARKSATKKEYIYKINFGSFKSSLNDYYYQPRNKLDISLMKDASKVFLGTHDFRNFISGENDNTVTTIYSITFNKKMDKRLEIIFVGTGFYRYMIRNLVGALIEVGKYKTSKEILQKMLDTVDIKKSLPTAPPEGLYLAKVWYK
ncbi:MAG: tRNA pseudouridine(38-40) synthase TruA [Bacilli bacterium]